MARGFSRLDRYEHTFHQIGQQTVVLDGDRASGETYCLAHHVEVAADGSPEPYVAFKLDPHKVPDLPQPRPRYEIWVYSPRVEGVHLRFGAVARGGLRWSDRREDFRTEVLGLVKAQAVKNAVIVPVGAKGGFVVKRPPAPTGRPPGPGPGPGCSPPHAMPPTGSALRSRSPPMTGESCSPTRRTPTSSGSKVCHARGNRA